MQMTLKKNKVCVIELKFITLEVQKCPKFVTDSV